MDVEKGKIEDTGGSGGSYSIKTQFNSEEQWTKALKFMLTNLKWGLAWVSSQFYNKWLSFFLSSFALKAFNFVLFAEKESVKFGYY